MQTSKFNLQKGDKFIGRPSCPRDENTGQILFVPQPYEKPLTVSKLLKSGVKSQERGFIHNNCIIEKLPNETT